MKPNQRKPKPAKKRPCRQCALWHKRATGIESAYTQASAERDAAIKERDEWERREGVADFSVCKWKRDYAALESRYKELRCEAGKLLDMPSTIERTQELSGEQWFIITLRGEIWSAWMTQIETVKSLLAQTTNQSLVGDPGQPRQG